MFVISDVVMPDVFGSLIARLKITNYS